MKFLLLGALIFLFYRMVTKPKQIDPPITKRPLQEEEDNDGFVDYEEID